MSSEVKLFESAELKEMLPVSREMLDGIEQLTIDARKLHAALKVGRVFAAWITGRIEEYNFIENKDFMVFSETGKNLFGGRPSKEYLLSLDMGKELAMVENNEEGRKIRRYFIACEKALRTKAALSATSKVQVDLAEAIFRAAKIEGNQLALALDRLHNTVTGVSALRGAGVELVAPMQSQLFTPTQIGKAMEPPLSARKVNNLLELKGYQENVDGLWSPTDKGRAAGVVLMDTGKRHGNGTPIRQIKWPHTILAEMKI